MQTIEKLPHWDVSNIFPSLESPEFEKALAELPVLIDQLEAAFNQHNVNHLKDIDHKAFSQSFDEVYPLVENIFGKLELVNSYIQAFTTTDTKNSLAKAKSSELDNCKVDFDQLFTRFIAWIGSVDIKQLVKYSLSAQNIAYSLTKTNERAKHLLDHKAENLASMLKPTLFAVWEQLFEDITSQLITKVQLPDGEKELPMPLVQVMSYHPDPAVRKAAYQAEINTWPTVAVPLAAALNSIKGSVNILAKQRGYADALDISLRKSGIDLEILQAMQNACKKSFVDFRRFYQVKAKLLGHQNGLPWFDRLAPIGKGQIWSYEAARDFIFENFALYSKKLRDFAEKVYSSNWIDAEARPGKVGGGFCMSMGRHESRILVNFEQSFESMSTLAHELGHAYHHFNRQNRPRLEKLLNYPMNLAETASIFCETIVTNAALQKTSGLEKLAILNNEIQGQAMVVVDIHSRFLFESWVFEKRSERELSIDEFCQLIVKAQKETYGNGLDEKYLQPFAWASKPHYYDESSFYNYPYTFGLLFGLGLYAHYQKDPEAFRDGYDDLLANTSTQSPADLAQRYGIDIRDEGFWSSSLDAIRRKIDEFEKLAMS